MRNLLIITMMLSLGLSQLSLLKKSTNQGVNEHPYSLINNLDSKPTIIVLPAVDVEALKNEDKNREAGTPFRYGFTHEINLSSETDGKWIRMDDGSAIWQISFQSKDAHSLGFIFENFHIPVDGILYIYTPDYKIIHGPFTSKDNPQLRVFSSPYIQDDTAIIEYYHPTAKTQNELSLVITKVIHDYLDVMNYLQNGNSHLNNNSQNVNNTPQNLDNNPQESILKKNNSVKKNTFQSNADEYRSIRLPSKENVDRDCSNCEFDYSDYGGECCDSVWDEYGVNCADLEAHFDWDCSGCTCPGDEEGECGDGVCNDNEDCATCPDDCPNGCGECSSGYVADCADDDCCLESWIGDGSFCDGTDQEWGCDLTCYDNDGGDCFECPDGEYECLDGSCVLCISDCPENFCGNGYLADCSCDGDCCPESWLGDGYADCEDQEWDCDLSCYDHDGGDCVYNNGDPCTDGFVNDCSDDGDCCPQYWVGDLHSDCESQSRGCDLTCYDNDGGQCADFYYPDDGICDEFYVNNCSGDGGCCPDHWIDNNSCNDGDNNYCNEDVSVGCDSCQYDFTEYGAECCDSAWDEHGISCADLEANYDWDCSGCSCPGDCSSSNQCDLTCYDLDGGDCGDVYYSEDGVCDEFYVADCADDGDCCPEHWIADYVEDCQEQIRGCDLSCYDNDGGDCNIVYGAEGCGDDVVCADDFYEDIIHSSTQLLMVGYICSGTIINDNSNSGVPYYLTAKHCLDGTGSPQEYQFVFNYQTDECEGVHPAGIDFPHAMGSILLASSEEINDGDYALLQIMDDIPAELNMFYAGWNSEEILPNIECGISHPAGLPKIINYAGGVTPEVSGWTPTGTDHYLFSWEHGGGTWGGSSGSAIYNTDLQVVGQLSGGVPHDICGYYPDYYGMFSSGWDDMWPFISPDSNYRHAIDGIYNSYIYDGGQCGDGFCDENESWESCDEDCLAPGECYSEGYISDCSDDDCCPVDWLGDGYCDGIDQEWGCDLMCYHNDESDCPELSCGDDFCYGDETYETCPDDCAVGCVDCLYNYDTYGSECCDSAWGEYDINCADLEANYDWDCSGCSCPGDCTFENGDVNGDGNINVVDISSIIGYFVFELDISYCQYEAADLNGDDTLNVLDIVQLVNIILARSDYTDATTGMLIRSNNTMSLEADGYIGGVQMTLSHGSNFSIDLTNDALISDYNTTENKTILVIVTPADNDLFTYVGDFEIEEMIIANSVESIDVGLVSLKFGISSAYPNPFNPRTNISFSLPKAIDVAIQVYDLNGRVVKVLLKDNMEAGYHSVIWNADSYASGVYFVKMIAGDFIETQKLMLMK